MSYYMSGLSAFRGLGGEGCYSAASKAALTAEITQAMAVAEASQLPELHQMLTEVATTPTCESMPGNVTDTVSETLCGPNEFWNPDTGHCTPKQQMTKIGPQAICKGLGGKWDPTRPSGQECVYGVPGAQPAPMIPLNQPEGEAYCKSIGLEYDPSTHHCATTPAPKPSGGGGGGSPAPGPAPATTPSAEAPKLSTANVMLWAAGGAAVLLVGAALLGKKKPAPRTAVANRRYNGRTEHYRGWTIRFRTVGQKFGTRAMATKSGRRLHGEVVPYGFEDSAMRSVKRVIDSAMA